MSEGYDLRPLELDAQGIAAITRLMQVVFPNAQHFTEAVIQWQYVQNPEGKAVGFNAWKDGTLAGHYVTIPLVARVNGKEEKGLLSLNTATHPEHQGKGLFTKLANATYEEGARQGYGFVIGVANANSTHGFTKKLGFQLVSPLLAMAGIGPFRRNAKVDPAYERIWNEASLKWRLAHPVFTPRYRATSEKEFDVLLSGRKQRGGHLVLAAADGSQIPRAIMAPSGSSTPFRIWIGLDCGIRWKGRPWFNIPMRFRPSPLNLIFKDLTGNGRTLDPVRVRFQAIDFDVL